MFVVPSVVLLSSLVLRVDSGAARTMGDGSRAIVFPGPAEPARFERRPMVPPSDLCHGRDFCEDPTEYPQDVIDTVLERLKNQVGTGLFFSQGAFEDSVDYPDPTPQTTNRLPPRAQRPTGGNRNRQRFRPRLPKPQTRPEGKVNIDDYQNRDEVLDYDDVPDTVVPTGRIGGDVASNSSVRQSDFHDIHETPMCGTFVEYVYPKVARNTNNQFRYIINGRQIRGQPVQQVRTETCTSPNRPCELINGFTLEELGLTTYCRQKFTMRKLLALSEEGTEVIESFSFPSTCVCMQIDLATRGGFLASGVRRSNPLTDDESSPVGIQPKAPRSSGSAAEPQRETRTT